MVAPWLLSASERRDLLVGHPRELDQLRVARGVRLVAPGVRRRLADQVADVNARGHTAAVRVVTRRRREPREHPHPERALLALRGLVLLDRGLVLLGVLLE